MQIASAENFDKRKNDVFTQPHNQILPPTQTNLISDIITQTSNYQTSTKKINYKHERIITNQRELEIHTPINISKETHRKLGGAANIFDHDIY